MKYWAIKCRYATYEKKGLLQIAQTAIGLAAEWITGRTVSFSLGIPLHLPKYAKIFDLGYGSGHWLLSMSRLGYQNLSGYDIDSNSNNASRLLSASIEVNGGDFLENEYDEGSFDCIRLGHVLEHLLQPHEVLAKCCKMLKPGGMIVLGSPCIDSLVAHLPFKHFPGLQLPYHLYHHTPRSARLLFESEGFDVIKVKPYGVPVHVPVCMNAVLYDLGLKGIKIPSFFFLPFAPIHKLVCALTGKGEFLTALCRKRIANK